MNKVSDLTRDTRPSLEEVLLESIHIVVELDKNKKNTNGDVVQKENESFYYRVLFLFVKKVMNYYTFEEIEKWSKIELLDEAVLPKLKNIIGS